MRPLYLISLTLTAFLALQGCKKNDPNNPSETPNRPPGPFELVHAANGSVDVDVMPMLSWEISKDPDGDSVVYDLYLKKEDQEFELLTADIHENSFTPENRLITQTSYHWKVIAKDGKGGKGTESTVFQFSTRRIKDIQISMDDIATFGRYGHSSIEFKDKLWVVGGRSKDFFLNDILAYGKDNAWSSANASALFDARTEHTTSVFLEKIWLVGGAGKTMIYGDIWESSDGITWKGANIDAAFGPRYAHSSVVFDNKLWLIGGIKNTQGKKMNDVWYSQNGKTWQMSTANAPFSPRSNHASIVYNDKIWIVGGRDSVDRADVWYSENGKDWVSTTDNAAFGKRSEHSLTVFDNKMWLIGGIEYFGATPSYKNDIWWSVDGITWTQFSSNSHFSVRGSHSGVAYNNRLWVMFGRESVTDIKNDSWYME